MNHLGLVQGSQRLCQLGRRFAAAVPAQQAQRSGHSGQPLRHPRRTLLGGCCRWPQILGQHLKGQKRLCRSIEVQGSVENWCAGRQNLADRSRKDSKQHGAAAGGGGATAAPLHSSTAHLSTMQRSSRAAHRGRTFWSRSSHCHRWSALASSRASTSAAPPGRKEQAGC